MTVWWLFPNGLHILRCRILHCCIKCLYVHVPVVYFTISLLLDIYFTNSFLLDICFCFLLNMSLYSCLLFNQDKRLSTCEIALSKGYANNECHNWAIIWECRDHWAVWSQGVQYAYSTVLLGNLESETLEHSKYVELLWAFSMDKWYKSVAFKLFDHVP